MNETTNRLGLSAKPLIRDGHILHSIIDGSFIPTFVIDREHRVLYWNRALEEISKIAASSVIGTKEHLAGILLGPRPCMADLLVDGAQELPRYAGKHRSPR
jgi:PAS domain-containing protein